MNHTFSSLAIFNYRLWFASALVSNVGTWMQRIAQDWLVLTVLTRDSGVAVGITTGLQFVPFLLLGPFTGVVADRVDHRKMLMVTQSAAGALGAGLGVLVLSGNAELIHVYGFALALGVVTAFDAPARQIFVGDLVPRTLLSNAVGLNSASFNARERWDGEGSPTLYVTVGGTVVGLFTTHDPVRASSRATVDALHRQGVSVALITGDSQAVADRVARELGIDEVFAEVLPQDKDSAVEKLQAGGGKVAMVGDGVNDAPALARANVGIAIGAGTDVAMEAAGVVLASSDPRGVLAIVALSRASHRKMIQNLVWATAYNALAIPVAAGVFSGFGFTLNPAAAAIAMSLSTIVVALNAQLLRRVDLSYEALAPAAASGAPHSERQDHPDGAVSPV